MGKYSENALNYFSEEELDKYVLMARTTKDPSFYPDEPLESLWVEDRNGSGSGVYVICRGSFIIADKLVELEAEVLLDELQAACDE